MNVDQHIALKNIDKLLKLISTNRSNRKDYNIYMQNVCHDMVKRIVQRNKQLTNKQMLLLNKFYRDLIARQNYNSPEEWFNREQ